MITSLKATSRSILNVKLPLSVSMPQCQKEHQRSRYPTPVRSAKAYQDYIEHRTVPNKCCVRSFNQLMHERLFLALTSRHSRHSSALPLRHQPMRLFWLTG